MRLSDTLYGFPYNVPIMSSKPFNFLTISVRVAQAMAYNHIRVRLETESSEKRLTAAVGHVEVIAIWPTEYVSFLPT